MWDLVLFLSLHPSCFYHNYVAFSEINTIGYCRIYSMNLVPFQNPYLWSQKKCYGSGMHKLLCPTQRFDTRIAQCLRPREFPSPKPSHGMPCIFVMHHINKLAHSSLHYYCHIIAPCVFLMNSIGERWIQVCGADRRYWPGSILWWNDYVIVFFVYLCDNQCASYAAGPSATDVFRQPLFTSPIFCL